MPEVVSEVSRIGRYPVKSMLGEALEPVPVADDGVVGDRAHALIDDETARSSV
jgi:uncharacterized protein YcbX